MALTNQEQIQVDDIDSRVLSNLSEIAKNQAEIKSIDNESYLRLISRSFVFSGCQIDKSSSDLSISLSNGADQKSISFVNGKYLEIQNTTIFVNSNSTGSTRIDLCYLTKEGALFVKQGITGSGLAPSLPSNSLELYTISIPNNTTSNLSICTLIDRRIQAKSGSYLPSTGIIKNESFLLTQQDGPNAPGLYYFNISWNYISGGGLASNYYTKAQQDIFNVAMKEAEFRAIQNENKRTRGGSGVDEYAKNDYGISINKGMQVAPSNSTYIALGLSSAGKINETKLNVDGVSINVLAINHINNTTITLPDAPIDEKARQDFIGLEYWEEPVADKDIVYPNGCTQSLSTSMNGISTVVGSFVGADTYSRFGTWQASGDLVGRGVIWSTATVLQKMAMLSEPKNNLFVNKLGEVTQGRNRLRVAKGVSGGKWNNVDFSTYGGQLSDKDYNAQIDMYPQGKQSAPLASSTNWTNSNGHSSYTAKSKINKGVYISPVYSAPDYNLSSNGHVNLLPMAMISRNRNQGAYHPEFNSGGSKKFIDDKFHYDTAQVITSTADCFDISKILVSSGNIASGKSGRTNDGLYYDEINERDVRDLRLPTNYSKNVDIELSEYISASKRGYEAEKEMHIESIVADSVYMGGTRTRIIQNTSTLINNSLIPNGLFSTNGFIKIDNGSFYKINTVITSGGKDYIDLSELEGNQTANITLTSSYSLIFFKNSDKYSNNTITRCDIIGDPASYTFSSHVGVANLVNVNDGSSNLPDGSKTQFLLSKKYSSISKVIKNDVLLTLTTDYTFSTTTNKVTFVSAPLSADVVKIFGDGYADDLIPSVREEVEDLTLSDVIATSSAYSTEGAKLLANLISKIATNTSATSLSSKTLLTKFIYPSSSKMTSSDSNRAPSHDAFSLYNTSKPSLKLILQQTEKDGLLYNTIIFKEMKYDVDWGDDQKFDITDNIKTKTDDNGNVIIYGTVISVNPVGFAKE
ncbi:MAG: hypothetical protein COB02_12240 [Candidatus Cloacimonadota bacterium]|nr:MAG: hypothetical protein COB02_12240 [Candidatus Cloacimonadota bacterium]